MAVFYRIDTDGIAGMFHAGDGLRDPNAKAVIQHLFGD